MRTARGVELVERDPREPGAGEVRVAVAAAGICRTDLHVAGGAIATAGPVVLGHEAAGWIEAAGPGVEVAPGQLVAIDPRVPGGMLGIDGDGAFAGAVIVAARAVFPMPASMSPLRAAYLEPVAAALAVAEARLDPAGDGAVAGTGRIAELTARALLACGHKEPARAGRARDLERDRFDFVVETGGEPSLDPLIGAVRPGGVVVLKSRPPAPVSIDLRAAVQRRVIMRAVSYGSFAAAADLLASGRIYVGDLIGERFALADWEQAFAAARASEDRKHFFAPCLGA